ncbi:MAG: bifunctional oligoribonuclease/PAP phosphatase NrnA [Anaerolineae bacterium]
MMRTDWAEAAAAVRNAASILVVSHVKPDGDAIGSLLGLGIALREVGKKVDAAVDDGVPDFLGFLPQSETVLPDLTNGQWDLMISVDASDAERTGKVGHYGRDHAPKVVNLDHHPTNTEFGDIHLIVPQAVSASEIIYDWLGKMNITPSQPVATALLTGLITDTMGFRTSNVVARTLQVAYELTTCGAPYLDIMTRTMVNKPLSHILLWQQALPSLEVMDGIITSVITPENLKQSEIRDMTDGGLVSLLVAAEEISIACVFKVLDANSVEVSFRSKPGFDVGSVAFALGGGGHKPAAGATISGSLDDIKAQVMPLLQQALAQGRTLSA